MQSDALASQVVGITVTYGRRWYLLQRALDSLFQEGVLHIIVVNNGSGDPISQLAGDRYSHAVTILDLNKNTGSANGFKLGIQAALEIQAKFVIMLDDDNVLETGALQELLQAHKNISSDNKRSNAVVAFRPDHQSDVALNVPEKYSIPHPNSFLGFHVYSLPFKIIRRCFPKKIYESSRAQCLKMDVAPYSGLLVSYGLLSQIGLPNSDLVLYADDTEFTYRITQQGGAIWLITAAKIVDLEPSWSIKKNFSSSFAALLMGPGDFRAYYAMRNQAFFERHRRPHNPFIRGLNKHIYMFVLKCIAIQLRRVDRYKIIKSAIEDGEKRKLGIHPAYPL